MATIYYHPSGKVLLSGLPGSNHSEEAAEEASRQCEWLQTPLLLDDDDGQWIFHPGGTIEMVGAPSSYEPREAVMLYNDPLDPIHPGPACRVYDMTGALIESGPVNTLQALMAALAGRDLLTDSEYPPDSLPTFGGDEPDDKRGVWSWDQESLLVGPSIDALEIIMRGLNNDA